MVTSAEVVQIINRVASHKGEIKKLETLRKSLVADKPSIVSVAIWGYLRARRRNSR